jgi:hypothetical protein
LWYFAILANRAGTKLSDIANNIGRGLTDWDDAGSPEIAFAAVQGATTGVKQQPTKEFERTLLDLAAEIGMVLSEHQAGRLSRLPLRGCSLNWGGPS